MTVRQTVGSPSAKSTLIVQFLRFGTVGTSGFLIDTAIVYGLVGMLGLYGAGMSPIWLRQPHAGRLTVSGRSVAAAAAWRIITGQHIF